MDKSELPFVDKGISSEKKEVIENEPPRLDVGFVVSDFDIPPSAMSAADPSTVAEQWQIQLDHFMGKSVEIQAERISTLSNIHAVPVPSVNGDGAVGVHHPSYNQDVISRDTQVKELAYNQTIKGFLLADRIGALYYVVHPVTVDDWKTDREKQSRLALDWVTDLAEFQARYGLTPILCIENLEVPKTPASMEEVLLFLRTFQDEGLPVGFIFDVAHHWHNYVNLFQYLEGSKIIEQDAYLALLTSHLNSIHAHFPEMLIAHHVTQSYVDVEKNTHVTHGLPGSLEGDPLNLEGLSKSPDESLEWLNTVDVLQALNKVAIENKIAVTRVILEVHHREPPELIAVANAMMNIWSK